jgi:hypothetical protein
MPFRPALPARFDPHGVKMWWTLPVSVDPDVMAVAPDPVAFDPDVIAGRTVAFNDHFSSRRGWGFVNDDHFSRTGRTFRDDHPWRRRRRRLLHDNPSMGTTLGFFNDTTGKCGGGEANGSEAQGGEGDRGVSL